ncbi:MAG TPA: hypothetical protein PLZ53_08775 [Candidatus Hydrogenedentes bacterium]|nr:hypothetical protein [Candidatus Hydrogenedentota bacterium]
MPRYEYEVKKGPGEVVNGVLEAENKRAAVARLREMGYFPIRVDEQVEEEATMGTLLHVVKAAGDRNLIMVEAYLVHQD